ncbi:tubulin-folding cofactor B-like [Hibiscus syriacus]|uniref:tubulin-folding cofactor B-like n=1 Tax=Hibiscus syriacus TaxID=106335 RepID=UPI001922A456|nr:tubulin-folding cofactor B-like [Hibiscus syriacus]
MHLWEEYFKQFSEDHLWSNYSLDDLDSSSSSYEEWMKESIKCILDQHKELKREEEEEKKNGELASRHNKRVIERFRIHIIELDPSSVTSGGWLEDTSLVEKYTISEDEYIKRSGTFRKFKEQMASQNPSAFKNKMSDDYMEDLCGNITVGDRCEVDPGEKRGVIKYVGRAEALGPGFWIGVQYDEPLGKHDGMVKGTRYFQFPSLCGAMVRPDKVKVGDYPERDPFEEDEI